jgi:hypothetical protein
MKIRGPLVTLGAVAALGIGIWLVNVSKEEPEPAPPVAQTTTTTAVPAPQPPAPPTPARAAFPAKADYVGKVPTANGTITLDSSIEGDDAIAYACDGNTVEVWLRGPAVNGAVSLVSKDKASRLEGRLDGSAVVGTLWIRGQKWDFKADPAQPPAGLYVYEDAGDSGGGRKRCLTRRPRCRRRRYARREAGSRCWLPSRSVRSSLLGSEFSANSMSRNSFRSAWRGSPAAPR